MVMIDPALPALFASARTARLRSRLRDMHVSLIGTVTAIAALLVLGGMIARGFSDNGLRLGSELGWRFACFVFFAALVSGPLCRLLGLADGPALAALRRQMLWSFCASYAVFLASVLLPNLLGGVLHANLGAGMVLFALFGGAVTAVMAYAADASSALRLGATARRAMLIVGAGFFWLTYALTGLAHLAGPHRPDAFYGLSLSGMLAALLLRFAERLVRRLRGGDEVAPLF